MVDKYKHSMGEGAGAAASCPRATMHHGQADAHGLMVTSALLMLCWGGRRATHCCPHWLQVARQSDILFVAVKPPYVVPVCALICMSVCIVFNPSFFSFPFLFPFSFLLGQGARGGDPSLQRFPSCTHCRQQAALPGLSQLRAPNHQLRRSSLCVFPTVRDSWCLLATPTGPEGGAASAGRQPHHCLHCSRHHTR